MGKLTVYAGTTFAQFYMDKMNPLKGFIDTFIKKSLSEYEYDKTKHTYTFICDYVLRDDSLNSITIPINFLPLMEDFLTACGHPNVIEVKELPPIDPRETTIHPNPKWVPREHQIPVIDYLLHNPRSRKGISLATGLGKTFIANYSMASLKMVTMIVTASNIAQWVKNVAEQTSIHESFTYLDDKDYNNPYKWVRDINAQAKIKGSKLWLLMGSESFYQLANDKVMPDVFICSTTTLREFADGGESYKNLPWNYQGFLKTYGIGTKIVDEAHLNFHAINRIDLRSNVKNNFYMTATFLKSGTAASRIFNTIYPKEMQYGNSDNEPYTNVTVYAFRGNVPQHFVKRKRGYNAIKYEQYILKRPMWLKQFLDNIVLTEVYTHFVRKRREGEKCLLFFATKDMIFTVRDYLNRELSKYGVVAKEKVGGTPDDVLNDPQYHVYVGTPGGMGTGRDIPKLRTAINFISVDSKPLIKQMFGRLRRLPDVDTEWVDNVDYTIDSQVRHFFTRDRLYKKQAKDYKRVKIN